MTRLPPMPLAARIAEKVMGWKVCRDLDCSGCEAAICWYAPPMGQPPSAGWEVWRPDGGSYWDPLANPADLLDVIGELRGRGFDCEIMIEAWGARVRFGASADRLGSRAERAVKGDWRAALARAVCRAALDAVR